MDMEWLRRREVAERIGVCESTLEKLALTGGGPPFARINSAVRYRWSDVEAWMASRVAVSTSEHDRRDGSMPRAVGGQR